MADAISKTTEYCEVCNSIVEFEIMFSYPYNVNYINEEQKEGICITLCKCLHCGNPILTKEDFQITEEYYSAFDKIQLYPARNNYMLKNAPSMVVDPYNEAVKCFRVQAYEACVIMCRKGIEAICKDKGQTKGTLIEKLKKLNEAQILESTFYAWANQLRLIGNDGAHSHDKIVIQQDAKDAIDFFEALSTYLYYLVDRYKNLNDRRNKPS